MAKPLFYGGQAVIEGVMMRGQQHMAVAVRNPKGEIVIHGERLKGSIYTSSWWKLPFLRGVTMIWDTLVLGVRTLLYSANVAAAEEEVEITPRMMWVTLGTALAVIVAVFFLAPLLLVRWLEDNNPSLVSHVVEGVIRLALLVGYIAAIGFLPDIRRVFAYHGAEHKTINAMEAGAFLDVRTVQTHSTSHPRCGTAFLLIVMVISVVVFAIIGTENIWLRGVSRIVLIPLIAAIGYEIVRFSASHMKNRLVRALLSPGLALQALTTRPPDDKMVEVAIAALNHVMAADSAGKPESLTVNQ
ncbi:MAG: DUF1385 domain-containing protein [Chloroflexi bacterium]|nr:DUF1385 domain-containing protein [Chloroflexota bacterium]